MRRIHLSGLPLLVLSFLALLLAGCGGGGNQSSSPTLAPTGTISNGTNARDGAAMVWVPGGSFSMGTKFSPDYDPPHTQQVTLSGYWIYKDDVTVAQYRAFCAATGYALPPWPGSEYSWANYTDWTAPALQQMPIVDVKWTDAEAYCAWAGVQLPTEAQWEYAARGPAENNYPWGGTATATNPYNGWSDTNCVNWDNSANVGISTWPVGSFAADTSWCGAQDMAGNVFDWCADWYGNYSSRPVANPTGPSTGSYRVLRGGSWFIDFYGDEYDARGAYRYYYYPEYWFINIGFRCVSLSPGP